MKEISKNSSLSFTPLLFNVYWHFRDANVVSGCLWIRCVFNTGYILIKPVQMLLQIFISRMTWLENELVWNCSQRNQILSYQIVWQVEAHHPDKHCSDVTRERLQIPSQSWPLTNLISLIHMYLLNIMAETLQAFPLTYFTTQAVGSPRYLHSYFSRKRER